MENSGAAINQKQLLGHLVGLFVLFFTEMWERFSYYSYYREFDYSYLTPIRVLPKGNISSGIVPKLKHRLWLYK